MIRTWLDHKRHGIYPEPGGLNAQDAALIDDWSGIAARYNWLYRQLEPELQEERSAQRKRRKQERDAFDELSGNGGGGSFEDLFRG